MLKQSHNTSRVPVTVFWFIALSMVLTWGCGRSEGPVVEASRSEAERFLNTREGVAFVGDAACFDCHEDEYRGYQTHGMAHSLYPMTSEHAVEAFDSRLIRHPVSGYLYRALHENGRYWQEEVVTDEGGKEVHRLRREMTLVVGSGSAARTYLTESNGRLYELPLTWYTQSNRWDFSPGYADASIRFDRRIPDRCMACHNSYPETVPFVEGKYEEVPSGIGCERCHGPGELHVEARLAGVGAQEEVVDSTIVNPAHLSLDRRLDVCQQCHLHATVSLLRDGRHAFDFRPSQPLDEYLTLFSLEDGDPGAIPVISHADRMKQSPCFLSTVNTVAPMDCMTCHDPHQGFRDFDHTYFNRKCVDCHAIPDLQASLNDAEQRTIHTAGANCFSCHMPRVEAEDAPHASFTDHFIRVVERVQEPSASRTESGDLEPYFARDRGTRVGAYYAGMAYIALARQKGGTDLLEKGVEVLEEALSTAADSAGEGHFLLGIALAQLGRPQEAIAPLEESVRRAPDVPERLNALAQVYEAQQTTSARIRGLYERALRVQPAAADVRVNYGRFLEASAKLPAAIRQYEMAASEEPWLETAHYNLGTAHLRSGDFERAEASLVRAVELDPAYVEARGNLAVLYLQTDRPREAQLQFERAVEFSPDHPVALANLGSFYMNAGDISRAVPLLERAVAADPDYVTAMVNLAVAYVNLDRPEDAEVHARRALQLDPSNEAARQVLLAVE